MPESTDYEYDFDPSAENNTAASIARMVLQGGKRVLDLGSGPGIVAGYLQRECGRDVTCVDNDPSLLEAAQSRGVGQTLLADLNDSSWLDDLDGERFDVIVLADVLEHLLEPQLVLSAIRENALLNDDGFVVVSIPNAAHEAVIAELVTGHFTYHPTGLLDRTHIRFFTKDSFTELAEGQGFNVTAVERTLRTLENTEFRLRKAELDAEVRQTLASRGLESRSYQFVMRLVPMDIPQATAELRRKVDDLLGEIAVFEDKQMALREEHAAAVAELEEHHQTARERGQSELEATRKRAEADRDAQTAEIAALRERLQGVETELASALAAADRFSGEVAAANDRLKKVLGDERGQHLRRLKEMQQELDAAIQVRRELSERLADSEENLAAAQLDLQKAHDSFTWKAGRAVKGLVYPAIKVRSWLQRGGATSTPAPAPPAPKKKRPAQKVEALELTTFDHPLKEVYVGEAGRPAFEHNGGRRVAFAVYTDDFYEGRGDLYVAVGIGRELGKRGWDVIYQHRNHWYELPEEPDTVVAMLADFRPSELGPNVECVAWVRNTVTEWLAHPELNLFDMVLCSSERSRAAIEEVYAGPTGVLPIGVDAELFAPPEETVRRRGAVSTVNQWGRERDVNRALRSLPIRFPLRIFGRSIGLAETLVPYTGGSLTFFAIPSVYQQAAVVLDDFNHTTVEWGNVNSRLFESLAAGALPVTNTGRGLAELGLGEVPTYERPEDLNPLVSSLLADPERLERLAESLGSVVRSEHSFAVRADSMMALLSERERPSDRRTVVGFFPDYRAGNPYLSMLYGKLADANAVAVPLEGAFAPATAAPFRRADGNMVFHLHWTAPILGPARDEVNALDRVQVITQGIDEFRDSGGRFVWTIHNVMPHECQYPDVERVLRRELALRADAIHVLCPETVDAVAEQYHLPSDRLEVIPHSSFIGVYPDALDEGLARERLGVSKDDLVLLALGGIRPYKGIDRLLDAFDEALDHDDRLRLIIAGKPGRFPGVRELEERARSHPRIMANFNAIPDEELQLFYKAANVVVLPHRAVLNSGALLLAYSFARPVIAPATGCVTELLEPSASISFDADTDGALAAALAKAGDIAGRDSQRAARAIAERYTRSDMATDYASLIRRLTGRTAAAS